MRRTRSSSNRGRLLAGGDEAARLLLISLVIAGGSNLLFHVVMSRILSPIEFGELGAVLALLTVALVPATAVQLSITASIARRTSAGTPDRLQAHLLRWAVAGTLMIAVAAPAITSFLRLDSVITPILAALILIPTASLVVSRGVLLGRQQYGPVAIATIGGSVVKLVGGIGAVGLGAGVEGALLAVLGAEFVTAALIRRPLANVTKDHSTPLRIRRDETWRTIVAYSGFWLLANVGVVLARHHSPIDSGGFAVAWVVAGVVLFLPAAVVNVVYPRLAGEDNTEARRVMSRTLLTSLGLSLAVAAIPIVAPSWVIRVVSGMDYADAAPTLRLLALAFVVIALNNVTVHYHMARARHAAGYSWLGVAVVIGGSFVVAGDTTQLATLVVIGTTISLALQLAAASRVPNVPPRTLASHRHIATPAELDMTIVVPFLDPGPAITHSLEELDRTLRETGLSYELIAVSDGSTDGSPHLVRSLTLDRLRLIELPQNLGKGGALRIGMSHGRGSYIGFIDGDGDIDPKVIAEFASAVSQPVRPDMVVASKSHPRSSVAMSTPRRLMSWAYRFLIRTLFRLEVRDTQTGAKVIRREVLADSLPHLMERRFTLDLELIVVARGHGHRTFVEVPVTLRHRMSSTIRPTDVVLMIRDTLAVYLRLMTGHQYDPCTTAQPPNSTMLRPQPVHAG